MVARLLERAQPAAKLEGWVRAAVPDSRPPPSVAESELQAANCPQVAWQAPFGAPQGCQGPSDGQLAASHRVE